MSVSFRRAVAADVDVLIPWIKKLHAQDHIVVEETVVRTAVTGLLEDESRGMVWIVHDGGAAAGYAVVTYGYSLEFHGQDAFLDELFIEEGHRGKGIGRQAMRFIFGECEKAGVNALRLEVDRSNKTAQSLYRKLGFVDHDRYLMTKRLT